MTTEWIKNVRKTDIDNISMNSTDSTLTVIFDVPVGADGEVAEYTEEISLDDAPEELRMAASMLSEAVVNAVKARLTKPEEVRCTTCTGACCYKFSAVRVTKADLDAFTAAGMKVEELVDLYVEYSKYNESDWAGYVGQMKEQPVPADISRDAFDAGTTGCIKLTPKGCSIYAHRPEVCRDFSARTCDDTYEEDERKARQRSQGKFTLHVVPS